MKLTKRQLMSIIREHLSSNDETPAPLNEFFGGRPIVKNMMPWGPAHIFAVVGAAPFKELMKIKSYWVDRNNDDLIDEDDLPYERSDYDSADKQQVNSALDKIFRLYGPTNEYDPAADIAEDIKASAGSLGTVLSLVSPFLPDDPLLPKADTFEHIFNGLIDRGVELEVVGYLRSALVKFLGILSNKFPNGTLTAEILAAGGPDAYLPDV